LSVSDWGGGDECARGCTIVPTEFSLGKYIVRSDIGISLFACRLHTGILYDIDTPR